MANLFDPSELYQLLAQSGLVPQWAKTFPTSGRGEYDISENRMVASTSDAPRNVGTKAHEFTHAVQFNLLSPAASKIKQKQAQGEKISKEELQFLDAAEKLFGQQFGTVGQYDRKKQIELNKASQAIDEMGWSSKGLKDEDKRYRGYRLNPSERQAFGVGRMSIGAANTQKTPEVNPHLDPTMTTEFSILMDLYNRLPKAVKETVTQERKERTERQRKASKETVYQYEDVFEDPFKSTIR